MSQGRNTSVVRILGSEYRVEADVDAARLQDMADYVDRKMRELAQDASPVASARTGVLAALNIAEELFREREGRRGVQEMVTRLLAIVEALEKDIEPRVEPGSEPSGSHE